MKRKFSLRLLLLLSASALVGVAQASAAGSYGLDWWTVDGGGATSSTGGSYALGGTIGQPDAGPSMNGGSYSLTGGFWGASVVVIPTISGNAGVGGATLSYSGGPTSADSVGNYSFTVPYGWTGTVTPSKANFTFSPVSKVYPAVTSDQTGQDFTATLLPPLPIEWVYPIHGSQACPAPQVGVALLLNNLLRKNGSFDPATITLKLDGTDVTGSAAVLQTETYPASVASVLHTPPSDLTLGAHYVELTYPSASGPRTLLWNFTVAAIPCPSDGSHQPEAAGEMP
jgi:hypothetical protein